MSLIKITLKIIQYLFLLVCLAFLISYFYEEKQTLINIINKAKPSYLFLSFGLWSLLVFIVPWFSHSITNSYQQNITLSDLFNTYINRLPAKYLPGGIWHTVARSHDLLKKGLTKKQLSILIIYENFWPVLVTALIGGAGVFFYHHESLWGTTALILSLSSLAIIPIFIALKNSSWVLSFRTYLKISLISIAFWLLAATSFLSYLSAFDISSLQATHFFNYLFSWLIGFLSIFTPQGIGVFELTMAQLTLFTIPNDEAMVIIAGFRLIVLTSDVANWLIYSFYRKFLTTATNTY